MSISLLTKHFNEYLSAKRMMERATRPSEPTYPVPKYTTGELVSSLRHQSQPYGVCDRCGSKLNRITDIGSPDEENKNDT
jgi:hypothetical protein